jgi:hypothetical protein
MSFPVVGSPNFYTNFGNPLIPPSEETTVPMEVEQSEERDLGSAVAESEIEGQPRERKRRRVASTDSMEIDGIPLQQEEDPFLMLRNLALDTECAHMYKSVFGCSFPLTLELFEAREKAKEVGDSSYLDQTNFVCVRTLHQLLHLINEWGIISDDLKALCGALDTSKILESPEVCKLMLWAVYEHNIHMVYRRVFHEPISFPTREDVSIHGKGMAKRLEVEGGAFPEVDLSDAGITRVPLVLSNFRNLTFLNLSFTREIVIPEIVKLPMLKWVQLQNCSLDEIPGWVFGLKDLEYLGVQDNCIISLPSKIEELFQLTILDISNNPIVSIQFNLDAMRLEHLYVSPNQLLSLPSEFKKKQNLTIIQNSRK